MAAGLARSRFGEVVLTYASRELIQEMVRSATLGKEKFKRKKELDVLTPCERESPQTEEAVRELFELSSGRRAQKMTLVATERITSVDLKEEGSLHIEQTLVDK
ncbi:hypothetical protein NDU88_007437 [Pleurodeles waltl]|uniref:Uncharacterized protein n=1 Tax=Pleurodeles waltl TaxID=8319 RepID=A0AAV7U327_PLEWA|nr:hypothetical protein NDU88_007437 [Pleurodeles waltl]